ncbi:MAG TPA: S-layer homology domain-containing protein [Clostridiales bacterium]|nr:S-layer homology domain-containing protein [Clostridiales bacterium]
MKKRILSILLLCCMVLTLLPTAAFAAGEIDEQFTLAPGGTYYFDLSAMGIPGTVNDALPDKTMRYIPFTYAGTVDAYKLTSAMAATDEYAETNKYAHSLFVADYTVTHTVSWDELNAGRLIFGRDYAAGGVDYILRAPSVGSGRIGSAESQRGTPPSNEWDRILDKNDGYIKNWFGMYSWGQDTLSTSASDRAARGYFPPGGWSSAPASHQDAVAGFRPVIEVLNPGSLGSDGLKAVTLDLGGGKLGDESSIQIIVETGSVFTAPASDGLTRPDGNTGNYFMWRDNDGQLYAPGDYVPADVTKLTAQFNLPEQFTLAPGGTYYFDLSAMGIPGTVNDALPDKTMGYVPFTYAGTVDSYKLTSEMATTEEDAEQNQYPHSLFVADYAVTHTISWDDLNTANLIFGKNYASGGVDYTLRAPSVGSNATGLGDSDPGEPQSNEWDTMLNKDSGYIQNWNEMYSWGQDTVSFDASGRAVRGYGSARRWYYYYASYSFPFVGFRPVLEVLNPGTMGSDRLKAVTLDLGGGKLGGSSEAIQIVVKNGESFAAPASEGLTRPDGNTGSYFEWLGSDGELYAPDDNVPADVTKLTAQFVPPEQFNLAPGGVYYFDLSGVGIPDTVNDALPDNTLHYVPFTYAGTVDAYKLTSEMATTEEYAETYKYAHSLFVADYAVTYAASWDHLNAIDMIFGKDYTAGGVDYTMRAPSEGSDYTGSGDSERGTPQSNEWDRLLDKDDGYIKNWNGIFSCGQDTVIRLPWRRTVRGHYSSRFCGHRHAAGQNPQVGFRPVLEVLNHDTIGPDGLKAVALDLGGGKLGDESSIRIIVKNGSAFTAPSGDGLTRPEGATGNYFKWLGSDGKLYAPGESVSADVTTLTARFVPDTYTVIVTTDTLPDGKTGKAYSHTLTAISTAPITWSIDEGALPAGLRLNEKTGEISGIPTAAGTATFTVKAENSEGSDTRALSIIISNPVEQTPVRYLDADGKERFCTEYTVLESVIIEDFFNSDSKWYDMPAGWYVVEGDVTITPRLDTHGAVNLILTDDCHLTVPWGINVKEGDTFTIYAQSTAEASMGKLTACLPEWSDHDKSVWPVAGLSGIGAGVRVWAANDNFYENEGTIIINGGNIRARGQYGSSAIGGSHQDRNVSSDGDTPGNLRQGGSITINGGIVCTELRTSGGAHTADSFGIGTCYGNGGSVTINGGTIIAEASSSAISSGRGGSITINGGNVTAHGGINRYENQPLYAIPGNGIGPLEGGSITINGGTVKASSEGDGFGIGGAGVHHTAEMHITINGGTIETTANRNNAAIGDKSKQKSSVTITGGVIHAVGKGSAAGIGSTGDIRITGGEISVFAEGGGAAIGSIGGVDCKSITINGNAIKSISSKDGACIGGAAGGSVGSITISDAELPLLSAEKILIGWDADSPGGKLTIRNCRVESTDELTGRTDGIRVGSNSELVIENSEIKLPHFRSIRVGGNGSIAVRDSDLRTYGIFMDETAQSPNDAKTLKRLEITNSTVLTGDIIGARGGYSSVEEVVIHDSSIRLNDEYTYNYCTIGGGTNGSFGSIDIQNSQIHIPSSGGNTAIGNGWQVYYNRESRIRIANSEVSVRCASLGPAIGAAWDSGSGRINIIIENSTVTAKGGNLRTDGNYVPGIGKNALGRAPEIGIQILNSTVDTFRLTEKGGTDYVYDDLHEKNLPGIPPENITICGSTVNRKTIDHSFDEYGKCAICGKYDLGYCYEHGLLTMEGLTDCVSDGSEKKLTGLSHKTGENETKQLAENTDYTASYSNNVHPYTLKPDDAGFDSEKAPKVTLYGTGNYCGKAEHYFTISENATAAPSITTDTLPNGKVGEAYSQTLTADGTTPITWGIDSGNLPADLTLDETTGEISGTPTAEGTAKFTVKATNSAGSDTKELSITITKDAPPSHEHSYGDWSKDGTSHWHECTDDDCPNREESITDKAAHIYTDDADTTCDTCGYERTVTPPSHEHSYGDWSKDGTSHWHECTDTDCPNREESITDKAAHVYTDDADTTCDVCGYERTVTPPAHEHSYGDWRKDGTSHWHECTDTDCPNREESITDKAAHVYTDDTDTTCNVCGYERIVTPPAHEHSYGDWRKDGTSHWHECTDTDCPNREESITDKAAHVYTDDTDTTCNVCGYERTVTPPSHEHSYGDWRKDGTSHWHECTDIDCPNREESITDKAAHVYTDDTDTTCNVCGYERTVTPPSHEHSYGDWRKDGTSHWHECTDIDCPNREESITDKAAHVYTDDTDTTCNVCGYERTVAPPAPTEFIVTFDGNGGTPSVGSMTTTDQKLTSLPSASRSGSYSFDGWYTKKSGGTKITTDTVFSANTTVYAHWTYTGGGGGGYNPPVTYYTLRFETGGGSDIPSVRETYNAYIDLSQYVPTWRGHTFIGWYSERGLINKVSGVYLTKDMTVYAGWRVDENPSTGANPFTDVSEKDWFYGDVMFVYENGLMLGTSKTLFSPHGTATRGMMATILWRMEGNPVPKGKNSFTDVEAGTWYADAITWTAENGIFAGYGKDKFGPDDPITREQLAAIFYRYADYKGYDLTVKGNLDKFKDADKITDYAKTAMQWAVGSGLVKGKSGNLLDPQGTATRAEIAAMLHRFIEKYELVQGKAPGGLMGWIDPKRLKSQRPATTAC